LLNEMDVDIANLTVSLEKIKKLLVFLRGYAIPVVYAKAKKGSVV